MQSRRTIREHVYDFIILTAGSLLLAFSIYFFYTQNQFSEGGFLGIALILKLEFNLSPSITIPLLDIPFLLYSIRRFGKNFFYKSLYGSLAFSLFYFLFESFSSLPFSTARHLGVASLIGGALNGIALAVILYQGGATGGDDILTLIISKCTKLSVGKVYFLFDTIILSVSFMYLTIPQFAVTLLASFISGVVLDVILRFLKTNLKKKTAEKDKIFTEGS